MGKIRSGTNKSSPALESANNPTDKKTNLNPNILAKEAPRKPAKPMPKLTELLEIAQSKAVCFLSKCLEKIEDQAGI